MSRAVPNLVAAMAAHSCPCVCVCGSRYLLCCGVRFNVMGERIGPPPNACKAQLSPYMLEELNN